MDVKALKRQFREKASKIPEQYYAVATLKAEGYTRKQCTHCKRHFWSTTASKTCGDSACSGGFRFLGNTPAKNKLDYVQTWKAFARLFEKQGYTPIDRYPVAARWRDDTDFVQASIYDFQPYVVNGEIDPPAKKLVVPQFCLRFNDIDNVGITGAHFTGFVMIGQHAFVPSADWDQEQYFQDIHAWLTKGLGLPKDEITFHEDAWAGGGNFGPCMEFFSRGLELGNQVYMQYEKTPTGSRELKLKVLDMGMGHERNSWFSQGKETSYEATFPTVLDQLRKATGIHTDPGFIRKFIPYSAYLNIDETEHIDKAWQLVARKLGTTAKELRQTIMPLSALYSIAEHSRTLLVALTDGVLPSNVKGGYNLRALYRRAQGFIDQYGWDLDIPKLAEQHAAYLKPLFPELKQNLKEVGEILKHEHSRYKETKARNRKTIKSIIAHPVSERKLVELYDSQGITPEEIAEEAKKEGKTITVPENFYALLAARHEQEEQATQTHKAERLDLDDLPPTEILYYDHYDLTEFQGIVLKVIGSRIILDRTAFYPTSGGQLHDLGTLNNKKVSNITKQGQVIIHHLADQHHGLKKGQTVQGSIDIGRRQQLAQHHTATHILNGVAKRLLGNHIWQAGAAKTLEKSRLDITHYENLTDEQVRDLEIRANEIIAENLPIYTSILPRDVAEKKYGFTIYQGGAVPGKKLRIVEIPGLDVEACGGTHLSLTGEVGRIKIIKTSKIQDGIIRLEFVAGKAAEQVFAQEGEEIADLERLLDCDADQIPARCKELFSLWKQVVKKKKPLPFTLQSTERYTGNVLEEAARILKTQPEHVVKTVQRFIAEIKKAAAPKGNA